MDELGIVVCATVPPLAVALQHFFPWARFNGGKGLSPLERYTLGALDIMAPPTAVYLCGGIKHPRELQILYIISAVSTGIATFLAWEIDRRNWTEHRGNNDFHGNPHFD